MPFEKTVLENGVTVLTETMPGFSSVSLGMWVGSGSRDEAPQQAGMAHFMEHMVFKGTPDKDAYQISQAFDALGAESNAFTTKEHTCFHARFLASRLQPVFELLADMVARPEFPQDTVDPERAVVLEEIAECEDTPDDAVFDLYSQTLCPTHPLGRPILGTPETVTVLGREELAAFHETHYVAGNLTVVACGNVSHASVVELAQRYLGGMEQKQAPTRSHLVEDERSFLSVSKKDIEQAHVVLGWPAFAADSDKRFALTLMESLLGGSSSSRLFTEIRERRGLAYSIYTTSLLYSDLGSFRIYAGTRTENLAQVLQLVAEEVEKLLDDGIDTEELDRARELVCGNFLLSLESTNMHMSRLGEMHMRGLALTTPEEAVEKIRQVTKEDVHALACELLKGKPSVAVVSPLEGALIKEMISND